MNIISYIKEVLYQPYFMGLLASITCACFYYLKRENIRKWEIIWMVYALVFVFAFYHFISIVIYRIHTPAIWDFTCFYLYGKVAAGGYNFYLPENFHHIFNSLQLSFSDYQGFVGEVVNVGFPYPPPTMLYFLPLGYLSYTNALIFWTLFNLIIVFGCIYLIYSLFFKTYKLNGLILVSTLVFLFSATQATVLNSQTNFIALFFLLLMKKYSDKKVSGIFLALAFFTKPYMIIFGIFFLLRMKWKTIIYCIISTLILVGLTTILFGKEILISYIFNNPTHRLPGSVFSESINQSLQGVLLRNNLILLDTPKTYLYISAGVFLAISYYLFYLFKKGLHDYMWPVLLLAALLIYPGTLSHYGVLLLFIIFQFFDGKKQLGLNLYLNIPLIGIFYYISTLSLFISILFLLICIILKSWRSPRVGFAESQDIV